MKETRKESTIFPASPEKSYGLMAIVQGKSALTEKEPEDTVFTYPNLVIRETIFFIFLATVLVIISLSFDAPLEELANPSKTPNPAKAPWYFLGLQELLHYYSPFIAGVLIPGVIVTGLIALPYIDYSRKGIGVWFSPERKTALILFTIFVVCVIVLTSIGYFFRGPGWMWVLPWEYKGH